MLADVTTGSIYGSGAAAVLGAPVGGDSKMVFPKTWNDNDDNICVHV